MKTLLFMLLVLVFSVPGLATYIYGSEKDLPDLVTTLLSVAAIVVTTVLLSGRLRSYPARLLTLYALLFLFLCYQFAGFIANYFLGEGFGEAFRYHFNPGVLLQTWHIYLDITLAFALSLLALLLLGLLLMRRQTSQRLGIRHCLPLLLCALLLDPEMRRMIGNQLKHGQATPPLSMETIDWEGLAIDAGAIDSAPVQAEPGRNLVLIFLEGLENTYTDEALFPGLTPYLNNVRAEALDFTDMRQVSGSEWTVGGMVSSLCGTPLLSERGLHGNSILFSRFLDRAACLSDVLATAGYRQHFMGGADISFAGKGAFLRAHSYDSVLGREQLLPLIPDPSYRNGWGLYDESLFALAWQEFETLAADDKPFNLTLLTLDTHHPDGFPSASCPRYAGMDNSILDAVHCTDTLLQQFMQKLEKHPEYEDTMVVLVSDHLSMRNAAFPLFPNNYPRRLLFTVLNAGDRGEIGITGSPMHVAPTVLDLLEVTHDARFLAGNSLVEAAETGETMTAGILNARARERALRYLNSTRLSSVPEDVCASQMLLSGAQRNGLRVGDSVLPLVQEGVVINKREFANRFMAVAVFDEDRVMRDSHVLAYEEWPDFSGELEGESLLVIGREDQLAGLIPTPELSAPFFGGDDGADAAAEAVVVALGSADGSFTLLGNFATLADISIPGSHCEAAFAGSGV